MGDTYNSVMKIVSAVLTGYTHLARLNNPISKEAQVRIKWFDYYRNHGGNARLTCRHFGISPQTFYRWKRRYNPRNPKTIEDRSHRPKRLRQPTYTNEQVETILKLRERYPRWGKEKIKVLLEKQGIQISVSMVGRIIRYLKNRNLLREPLINPVSVRKRARTRPYAVRKPKEYQAKLPGDIVQVDTLDLRPLPGVLLKHFSAYDVVARWNVMSVGHRATSNTAARFLDDIQNRSPYKVKAIQVDGGSEFESIFELECQKRGIKLFVLPPRSPKLNGGVERANRTHTEEFYEITDSTFDLADLRPKLLEWENICNTYRPNQALNYLTPLENLERNFKTGGKVSLII
jgi:putative transposase